MRAARNIMSRSIIDRLDELPTLPSIVHELSRVISDPMSSSKDIEALMSHDQSLTAKVLRLANSAYYAIPGGVSNLQRAISYIGYDTIHQLVLSAGLLQALDMKSRTVFDLNGFWKHSIGVAIAAETTARFIHHHAPADLFTCGLVHDMGKIALCVVAPGELAEAIAYAGAHRLTLHEAEEQLDLPRHEIIGRELALKWRLPVILQATVGNHHQMDISRRGNLSGEMNLNVDIICLSNLLIHALRFGHSGHDVIQGVPKELLDRMRLTEERLKELILKVRESIANQKAEGFLQIIGG